MSKHQRAAALFVAAASVLPSFAWAQVEEIIVTTRRKAESLQDVPLSVSAFSSEQIQRQGLQSIDDIVNLDPSVQFDRSFGPADTRITVRGLSNTRGRSNVAFLIDGVDVTTENLNAAGSGLLVNQRLLSDVERVEVVKGPQSALYGRAAFSGAVSYITKKPALDEWEGNVNWQVGDFGQKQFDVAAGGPIIGDVLGVRLSSVYWEEDGFYDNTVSGEPVGDAEGYALALTTLFAPNDVTEIKWRVEYSDEKLGPLPNVRIGGGTSGYNLRFFPYSPDALAAGLGQNNNRPGSTSTALADFGQYCPPEIRAQLAAQGNTAPGYCLPTNYGNAQAIFDAGGGVTQSPDPLTGVDYEGVGIENFRTTLNAVFNVDGIGTFTSITGFTDSEGTDAYDQDWQAPEFLYSNPDPVLAQAGRVAGQQAKSRAKTRQFSQELRFQSEFEGPVQFTVGSLYWDEKRDYQDQTYIIFCAPGRWNANLGRVEYLPGYCDGGATGGNTLLPGGVRAPTVTEWADYARQLAPQSWINWIADTRHWSFYGVIDWDITEEWQLSVESRTVSERFQFQKPAFSSCTNFGGPNPANRGLEQEVRDAQGNILNNQECISNVVLNPDLDILPGSAGPALGTAVGWRYQVASQDSHFSTPKVTLRWTPTDDASYYFSWGRAQKPGGIATTPGGGSPVSIQDDRFDPEKLEAWEIGAKTQWELAGALTFNIAGFFQDYTDKQIGTQEIDENGFLTPRIVNASSAEVWGVEVVAGWSPDFVEGLTLGVAWTYLDATYTGFVDETTSVQRAAQFGSCPVVLSERQNRLVCALDLSGNQLERTPEHSGVLTANYTRQFLDTSFDWFIETNATYQDERFLDADNTTFFDDYWLVDLRAGLQGENWDLLLFADNLFDDDTIKSGGAGPDFGPQVAELGFTAGFGVSHVFGTLPPPRVVGIRAAWRFGP